MENQLRTPVKLLITQAQGDAYGASFEFAEASFVLKNNLLRGYVDSSRHDLKPGVYTDDTQMSIALAEVILSGRSWTPVELADSFVKVFHRDVRQGYAGRFYDFLKSVHSGEEFMSKIRPTSDKNGAAMRAPVIGLLPDIDTVISRAEIQAKVTHDTREGIDSAVAASLCAHYFAYNLGGRKDLIGFLNKEVRGYEWGIPWDGFVPVKGIPTVRAAVTAIVQNDSLKEVLRACVACTGDVDSVAAVALACASMSADHKYDLPKFLQDDLENGTYGRDYIKDLDAKLERLLLLQGSKS